jgi:impB/mucB/samB family
LAAARGTDPVAVVAGAGPRPKNAGVTVVRRDWRRPQDARIALERRVWWRPEDAGAGRARTKDSDRRSVYSRRDVSSAPDERTFAHIDMDAFYVSVELQRRPELCGLPVVVAGSGPRAVVTTASYEARRYGIFSATPAERARRLCPEAVFLPPDFENYRARSREVHAVLRAHVELVESVGLDEAYLDLSALERPRSAA